VRSETVAPEVTMTLCPVALAVTCRRCPVFKICPAKAIIGDYKADEDEATSKEPDEDAPQSS
jgi:hypothetical protein